MKFKFLLFLNLITIADVNSSEKDVPKIALSMPEILYGFNMSVNKCSLEINRKYYRELLQEKNDNECTKSLFCTYCLKKSFQLDSEEIEFIRNYVKNLIVLKLESEKPPEMIF